MFQTGGNLQQCQSKSVLASLLENIFMGHEIIPDVVDEPPIYPLELTYKTIRTFPGRILFTSELETGQKNWTGPKFDY